MPTEAKTRKPYPKRESRLPSTDVLLKDLEELCTYKAVAEKYSCDPSYVSKLLRPLCPYHPHKWTPPRLEERLPDPQIVYAKYLELGTYAALLRHYEVSEHGMDCFFKRNGLEKKWTKKKGVKTYNHCCVCGKQLSYKIRGEGKKCRKCWMEGNRGKNHHNYGKPAPWATGPNNIHWKGGVSKDKKPRAENVDYREWRAAVYRRDRWRCCMCGKPSRKNLTIVAHHIYPWADFEDLRLDIDNGITLCRYCHGVTMRREMEFALLFRLYLEAA